jgi:hypothetical protein
MYFQNGELDFRHGGELLVQTTQAPQEALLLCISEDGLTETRCFSCAKPVFVAVSDDVIC